MQIVMLLLSFFLLLSFGNTGNAFCIGKASSGLKPLRSLTMGFRSTVRSIFKRDNKLKRTDEELKKGIAKFYDESSSIWLDVWGEDMHHGYYPDKSFKDHKAAQIAMIDKSLQWSFGTDFDKKINEINSFVDVGCGVGGSSRHIARKYGAKEGFGVSLSPYQIQRANGFTAEANLTNVLTYQVADAMNMPFPDKKFDLTWSMESGEHMPDKEKFVNELIRVTAPGGRIIIVTWCHREFKENEKELTEKETRLLNKINKAYYLPDWVPASDYVKLATEAGLEDVRQDDWSEFVAPFWPAVVRSALVPRNFVRMLKTGSTTVKGAIAALWMQRGFRKGLVKFVLITGRVPAETEIKTDSTKSEKL